MCVFEGNVATYATTSAVATTNSGFRIVTPQDSKGTPLLCRTRTECIDGVLPVTKGGTGITNITGSKLMASCADGISLEEIDVPVNHLSGLRGNIQSLIDGKEDAIRTYVVSVSNSSSSWTSATDSDSTTYYKRTITVNGILSTDNPITGLYLGSSNASGVDSEKIAFGCIDFIETNNNSITLYCYGDKPTSAFQIYLVCI